MSQDIHLNLIDPDPEQARQTFDEAGIEELAQSMDAKGLIVPIMARPVGDRFIIVHGERRYRAAKALGWETLPAEVRDVSPEEARWLSLIENIQRQDLSPIEEARAYRERLAEGITQEELGKRVGKSRTYIAQKLRLLNLPDDVQATVGDTLTEGHARQLLKLKDAKKQGELCEQAIAGEWTVAQMRREVDFALPLSPDERTELQKHEETIGDYLNHLRGLPRPPDPDNLIEVAIWAEQRLMHLGMTPVGNLLERRNDYAVIHIELECAAGGALTKIEQGNADPLTWEGLKAVLSAMRGESVT